MTPAQRREALLLFERGGTPWPTSYRGLPRHRPLGRLVDLGLADIGYVSLGALGGYAFSCQGYVPVWSDPIC